MDMLKMNHVGEDLECSPAVVTQAMQGLPVVMQGLPGIGSDPGLPGPKSTILALTNHITDGKSGQNQAHETIGHFVS